MKQPERLKHKAVGSTEVDWQSGYGDASTRKSLDHSGDGGVPLGISHSCLAQMEVGHLARRKHDQTSAALQELDRAAYSGHVSAGSRCAACRIHGNEQVVNFRDHGENVVREESHVGPDTPEHCRQNRALQNSERMIRDDQNGPTLRDLLNIAFANSVSDPKLLQ